MENPKWNPFGAREAYRDRRLDAPIVLRAVSVGISASCPPATVCRGNIFQTNAAHGLAVRPNVPAHLVAVSLAHDSEAGINAQILDAVSKLLVIGECVWRNGFRPEQPHGSLTGFQGRGAHKGTGYLN